MTMWDHLYMKRARFFIVGFSKLAKLDKDMWVCHANLIDLPHGKMLKSENVCTSNIHSHFVQKKTSIFILSCRFPQNNHEPFRNMIGLMVGFIYIIIKNFKGYESIFCV